MYSLALGFISAFCQLKHITRIRDLMSNHNLEKLVHAFIPRRLDYCNGLSKACLTDISPPRMLLLLGLFPK